MDPAKETSTSLARRDVMLQSAPTTHLSPFWGIVSSAIAAQILGILAHLRLLLLLVVQ